MTDVTNFESLLGAAKQQSEPQRLLFVFLQASDVSDHGEGEGQVGLLKSVMCVDKNLPELTTFSDLVVESQAMGQAWNIVLAVSLSGSKGNIPMLPLPIRRST